ncbi:MAG: 6-phosphogluconolactonase [Phycisphaerales bacterium]
MAHKRSHRQDPYALTDDVIAGPPLPGASDVVVTSTADEIIDRLAADIVAQAIECVRSFGDFHLALSGGRTPEPLYERLMYDPNFRVLPWRRTHLWIVDERPVDFSHPDSNFRMIRETIVDHADIPQEQVHPMFAQSPTAAVDYEAELRDQLVWREKGQDRLDFILLGVGSDGHTASLFPFSEAIHEDTRLVRMNRGGQTPEGGRLTMTYPLINAARCIAVLATGPGKRPAIERLLATERESVDALPIAGVEPVGGELRWYLDAAAAGR